MLTSSKQFKAVSSFGACVNRLEAFGKKFSYLYKHTSVYCEPYARYNVNVLEFPQIFTALLISPIPNLKNAKI